VREWLKCWIRALGKVMSTDIGCNIGKCQFGESFGEFLIERLGGRVGERLWEKSGIMLQE
jgi:hypothetical protein